MGGDGGREVLFRWEPGPRGVSEDAVMKCPSRAFGTGRAGFGGNVLYKDDVAWRLLGLPGSFKYCPGCRRVKTRRPPGILIVFCALQDSPIQVSPAQISLAQVSSVQAGPP